MQQLSKDRACRELPTNTRKHLPGRSYHCPVGEGIQIAPHLCSTFRMFVAIPLRWLIPERLKSAGLAVREAAMSHLQPVDLEIQGHGFERFLPPSVFEGNVASHLRAEILEVDIELRSSNLSQSIRTP